MKKKRRKSRRVRMAEAVRRECDPVLIAMGFRNPARHNWERFYVSRRNVFIRWRGEYYDEVYFHWRSFNRPSFFIEFLTTDLQRLGHDARTPTPRISACRMIAWYGRAPGLFGWLRFWGNDQFGPMQSIKATTALANERLREMNSYLLTGEPWSHVSFGFRYRPQDDDPTVSYPVFPMGIGDPPAEVRGSRGKSET